MVRQPRTLKAVKTRAGVLIVKTTGYTDIEKKCGMKKNQNNKMILFS
tara:strand:- start:408 stop:548 length:141 start_codon:yes stop_codon:yes gene_type:complete